MPSQSNAFLLLFKKMRGEIGNATTPDLIFNGLFVITTVVYKYFLAGGISLEDAPSIVVPAIWVVCLVILYFTLKSTWLLRKENIARWEAWQPIIIHSDHQRPRKPSIYPVAIPSISVCGLVAIIFGATFAMNPDATVPVSMAGRGIDFVLISLLHDCSGVPNMEEPGTH